MKKIICLICSVAFGLAISSCASTKVNENKPKKYREFTSHEIYDHSDFLEKVGYGNFNLKITESRIYGQKRDGEINTGQIPVSVIVIGGNAPAYVPVVLGLVE